jgi:serine/threonine protein kinase
VPEADRPPLEEHVLSCDRCAAALDQLYTSDELVGAMRQAGRAAVELPQGTAVQNVIDRLCKLRPPEATVEGPTETPPGGREPPHALLAPARGPDEIGRLGPYRVRKLLGQGGIGMVFLAEDVQLKRPVALKAMQPALAADAAARERFLCEAQATAALRHDHIVTIYQVGTDRDVPFLAMEFLEGLALDQWLTKGRQPTVAQVLRIGREVAAGLAAAHDKGLVHGDIKPGNIWLDAAHKGRVKILDFGLARATAGAVLGNPRFMAPEQARGEKVDARCDLFSLGCVLYRMATGELPFQRATTMAVLMAHAMDEPKPARDINPTIPPQVADLIAKLLAKDPADRPQSAREVVEAIKIIERDLASRSGEAVGRAERQR